MLLGWWKRLGLVWLHLRSGCGPTAGPVGLAFGRKNVGVAAEAVEQRGGQLLVAEDAEIDTTSAPRMRGKRGKNGSGRPHKAPSTAGNPSGDGRGNKPPKR